METNTYQRREDEPDHDEPARQQGNAVSGSLDVHTAFPDPFLSAWTRIDEKPRLIVRRDGQLIAFSENAFPLVAASGCLRLTGDVLAPSDPRLHHDFKALLAIQEWETRTLLLPMAGSGGHWVLRAATADNSLVCLLLHDATSKKRARIVDLREAFGLTHSEAAVAEDIYNGLVPQKIAEMHGISIHTVRAHMRRRYDKMGITSREELWQTINMYQS